MEILKDKILSLIITDKAFNYKPNKLEIEIPIIIKAVQITNNFYYTLNLITYRWKDYYSDEMKYVVKEYTEEYLSNSFKNLNLNTKTNNTLPKYKLTIQKNKKFKKKFKN